MRAGLPSKIRVDAVWSVSGTQQALLGFTAACFYNVAIWTAPDAASNPLAQVGFTFIRGNSDYLYAPMQHNGTFWSYIPGAPVADFTS